MVALYLLDTNIYISFYERYYPIKYFPSFWEQITPVLNANVKIPDIVVDETVQSEWFINQFLKVFYHQDFIDHRKYSNDWGEILNYIANSDCYKEEALTSDRAWTHERIADGWEIAIAKRDNLTIVSDEIPNRTLSNTHPSRNPKIPDIAANFNVPCINMLEFFDRVNLVI